MGVGGTRTGPAVGAEAATPDWVLVFFCFLALAVSFSARSTLGLVMPFWEADLSVSREFGSAVGASMLIVMAFLAPAAGHLADRFGAVTLLAAGLVVVGAGLLLASVSSAPLLVAASWVGVSAIGFGVVAMHVAATAVAPGAGTRRGLATGIATSGASAGQLLVIPFLGLVLQAAGWRFSLASVGVAAMVLGLLLATMRNGRTRAAGASAPRVSDAVGVGTQLRALARSPVFHALFWSFTLCGFTTAGVIEVHFLPYASFCGFAPVTGATAFGVLSAVNLCGMILAGWLADRMDRPLLLGAIYLLRAASFVLLMNIGSDVSLLYLFAVVFGLFDYATVPVTASLVATHLGTRAMGLAMGLISAGHAVGAAAAAYGAGVLFQMTDGYAWVWISSTALAAVAGVLVLPLGDRRGAGNGRVPA
ncbi:MFS transporter [Arenibaculum sp.]|uniref:MFS transporter n=1 Tax=Arenibaculum sp. TaxID=2865862 RepID=UPI002E14DECE|nr:MFS transporter [Arenibaculum sp.]